MPDTLRDPETIAFLPDISWLRPQTVADKLGGVGSAATRPRRRGSTATGSAASP